MAARRLRSKRKKRPEGRAVRLSKLALDYVETRRQGYRSFDAWFRKQFGLPDWRGNPQPLVEGMLEVTSGRFILKTSDWASVEAEANGAAVVEAAKLKTKRVRKPLRMREIA